MAGTGAGVLAGMRDRAAAYVVAAVLLLVSASAAFAHASLVRAEPADGSVSAAAPARVALVFSEPVSPIALRLIAPDGGAETLERFAVKGTTLEIQPPAGLTPGTYALSWRVVSEDGHPVGGTVAFSIGAPSASGAPAAEAADGAVRAAIWAAKVAFYAALFFGVGGAFAVAWLGAPSRSGARVAAAAMAAGVVVAPLSLGLQGVDALGASLDAVTNPLAWTTGWGVSYARTAVAATAALALGLASLRVCGLPARALSAAALLGVGLALAASGHAAAASPQALTRPMVFLHGAGVAFWAGALAPLGLALAREGAGALATLRRFARVVPFALLPLVISGLTLAAIQLESPAALVETAYGRVLLAKAALLAGLFALAALNRWRLTGAAENGDRRGRRNLARAIAVEIGLVAAILGVAALWRFTPPPRALAVAAAEPAAFHIHTDKAMADVTIAPGRAGPVTVSVVIMTGDFGPLDAKELTVALSNPAAGIEPIRRAATKPGDGTWRVDGLVIPAPGRWQARLDILVSDFKMVRVSGEVDIRR
ncbi:copper resistance protein CopC [Methylopila turkensis]|nr:copper resistance protein CopC [Methylopila turkensis]